jgi:hypothetical protein
MVKPLGKTTLFIAATLLAIPSAVVLPALALDPSLANGIVCAARGKTEAGKRLYAYTSVIDGNSMQKKQPVSVTLISPVSDTIGGEVLVIDKQRRTVSIESFEVATKPQMQPIALASTTFQGKNTFSGKTETGTPVSFTLEDNFRTFTLKHGNATYTGVCH